MTVTATNRKNSFPTNGVTVDFPFTFSVNTDSQVKALTRATDGTETDYTNFTVTLNPSIEGGTLTTGDVLNNVTLVVYRDTALNQQTDYVPGGRFPADSHEAALDKLTQISQEQQEEIDRSLKSSISDVSPPSLEEYDASVNARDAATLAAANNYTNKQVFYSGSITPDSLGALTNYQAASVADMILGITINGKSITNKDKIRWIVSGENDSFSCYEVITTPSDVNLGNGLYAKKLNLDDKETISKISDLDLPRQNAINLGLAYRKLLSGESLSIVCQGDSITAGYDVNSDDRVPGDSGDTGGATHAPITYPSALESMLNELTDSSVTIIKNAKSGDDAGESFARWPDNPNADVIHFMFGINDTASYDVQTYLNNMEALIKRAIGWGLGVVVHTTTAISFNNKREESIEYSTAIKRLAKQYNCPVFDSELVTQYGLYDGTYSDLVHFNKQGYHKYGRAVGSFILSGGWAQENEMVSGYLSQQPGRQSSSIGFHGKGAYTLIQNDPANSWVQQGGGALLTASQSGALSFSFRQDAEFMAIYVVGNIADVKCTIANIAPETLPQYANRGTDSINRITAKSRSRRGILETTSATIPDSRQPNQEGQVTLLGFTVGKGFKTISFETDGTQTSGRFVSGLILEQKTATEAQQIARDGNGGRYLTSNAYNVKYPYWDNLDDSSVVIPNGTIPSEVKIPTPDSLLPWIANNNSTFFDSIPCQVDVTKYQPSGFFRFVLQRNSSTYNDFFVHTLHNTNSDVVLTGAEIRAIDNSGVEQNRLPNSSEDSILVLKFTNAVNAYYDITVTSAAKPGQGSWLG